MNKIDCLQSFNQSIMQPVMRHVSLKKRITDADTVCD